MTSYKFMIYWKKWVAKLLAKNLKKSQKNIIDCGIMVMFVMYWRKTRCLIKSLINLLLFNFFICRCWKNNQPIYAKKKILTENNLYSYILMNKNFCTFYANSFLALVIRGLMQLKTCSWICRN